MTGIYSKRTRSSPVQVDYSTEVCAEQSRYFNLAEFINYRNNVSNSRYLYPVYVVVL